MRRLNLLVLLLATVLLLAAGCSKNVAPVDDSAGGPPAVEQPDSSSGDSDSGDSEQMNAEGFGRDSDLQGGDDLGSDEMGAGDDAYGRNPLQTVYFAFDSSALSDVALSALEANAEWLEQNPDARVVIEGHCDDRGTTEYNLELGARRAKSVRDHLGRLGVDVSRLETISYGEERPAAEGSGESAWSQNRRAEFRLES